MIALEGAEVVISTVGPLERVCRAGREEEGTLERFPWATVGETVGAVTEPRPETEGEGDGSEVRVERFGFTTKIFLGAGLRKGVEGGGTSVSDSESTIVVGGPAGDLTKNEGNKEEDSSEEEIEG